MTPLVVYGYKPGRGRINWENLETLETSSNELGSPR